MQTSDDQRRRTAAATAVEAASAHDSLFQIPLLVTDAMLGDGRESGERRSGSRASQQDQTRFRELLPLSLSLYAASVSANLCVSHRLRANAAIVAHDSDSE